MENPDHINGINWGLIAKYLANEATLEEIQEVELWLITNDQNKEELVQVYKSWQLSQLNKVDEKAAWKLVKEQIQPKSKAIKLPLIYKIAASFLLIATVFFILNRPKAIIDSNNIITISSKDKTMSVELEDGSFVHLNKNTTFRYPQKFNDSIRQVFIDGEGFFEVAKRNGLPFKVTTSKLDIKVLGTSFNVDSYTGKTQMAIEVRTGIVAVSRANITSKNNDQIILSEKEMATFLEDKDSLYKSPLSNENYLAWKTGVLEFDRTALLDVIKTLNETYDNNISINDQQLGNCLLTARFNNISLVEVLDALTSTYNLKIEQTSKGIIIYGKGCK
jgi:transmembrane sensor